MIEYKRPTELEQLIFGASSSTSRHCQDYLLVFSQPFVSGIRTLDVGGGGSNMTAWLLSQGADAYAIDPLYKTMPLVQAKVKESISRLVARYGNSAQWPAIVEQIKNRQQALEDFSASAKIHPERYIAEFATCIPFSDNNFDRAMSLNCVTPFLDQDGTLLRVAVDEMVRVVKPGGEVLLYPFNDTVYGFTDIAITASQLVPRRRSQKRLLRHLRTSGISFETFAVPAGNETLVITKPLR